MSPDDCNDRVKGLDVKLQAALGIAGLFLVQDSAEASESLAQQVRALGAFWQTVISMTLSPSSAETGIHKRK